MTPPAVSVPATGRITAGSVSFPLPDGWQHRPPSSAMRLAEAFVPGDAGGTGECALAFFSFGGTVEQNIERWRGMVLDAEGNPASTPSVKREVSGLTVHTVEFVGTYEDGMPGGPRTKRPDWMFRGAVIETSPQPTFIRMTGPRAAMEKTAPGWEALIAGATPHP